MALANSENVCMKIVEQTPTRLKFQNDSFMQVLSLALFGMFFLLPGLALLLFLGKLTTLECTRLEPQQVACEHSISGLLGKQVNKIPVGELKGAEVEVIQDSDGDTYRVVLLTQTRGKLRFTDTSSSGTDKYSTANQINDFINNSEQMSLQVQQDDCWFAYPFGGIFAFVGGSIVFCALNTKFNNIYTFDRQTRRLNLTQRGLFSRTDREFMFHEIARAKVTESRDSDGDVTHQAELVLRSGERFPLYRWTPREDHRKTVDMINQFLEGKAS